MQSSERASPSPLCRFSCHIFQQTAICHRAVLSVYCQCVPTIRPLDGTRLSLILGQPEGEPIVLTGIARWRDGHLFLDRGRHFLELKVPDEVCPHIRRVAPELRCILDGTEYTLLLTPDQSHLSNDDTPPENAATELECDKRLLELVSAA